MPSKTKMLDRGGFVRNPNLPLDAAFDDYLRQIDARFAAWQKALAAWQRSPFAADLLQFKKDAERAFEEFAADYLDSYTLRHVERDERFLPVGRFLAACRPVREPFAILHCGLDWPLHTVQQFGHGDLAAVNEAVRGETPLRWWQDGPQDHPCYLFGDCVWELRLAELNASDKGLTLLFEQTAEQERQKWGRLRQNPGAGREKQGEEFIAQSVRVVVWRRDGGKCVKCGTRDGIDFRYVVSANRGGNGSANNVRLLCAKCHEKMALAAAH
jgi:hypothetical protein